MLSLTALPVSRAGTTNAWNRVAGGDFNVAEHWTPNHVPGPDDTAKFDLDATYTVSFTTSPTNRSLLAERGNVTFDLGGNAYTISNHVDTVPILINADLPQLDTTGQPVLEIRNGDFEWDSSGTQYIRVGFQSSVNSSLRGAGALIVTDGAKVKFSRQLWVARARYSEGTVRISGAGTTLEMASPISLGFREARADLIVEDGGSVVFPSASHGIQAAFWGGGEGASLTVAGQGSRVETGYFDFGAGSAASGRIERGGVMLVKAGARIGGNRHASNWSPDALVEFTVTGEGSRLTAEASSNTAFFVGLNDIRATLVVEDGGLVECTHVTGSLFVEAPHGALRGAGGTILVNDRVQNMGLVAPGGKADTDLGELTVVGDYVQTGTGTLRIRIAEDGAHDRLIVTDEGEFQTALPLGNVALDGNLEIAFVDGAIVTGVFDVVEASGALTGTVSLSVDEDALPGGLPERFFLGADVVQESGKTVLRVTVSGPHDAPFVASYDPAPGATGVLPNADLILAFLQPVVAGDGVIEIRALSDGQLLESIDATGGRVTGYGTRVVTVSPLMEFGSEVSYYVEISAGAFQDAEHGAPYAGITGPQTWFFTGLDADAPYVLGYTPPRGGAVDLAWKGRSLVLHFNEPVEIGTGSIQIRYVANNSSFSTVNVTDSIRVRGGGTSTITITPAQALWFWDTGFYVLIPAGAFVDLAGNPYAGISDPAYWTFKTRNMRGPYIQDVRQTSAVIRWRDGHLPPATGHTVEYGLTESLGSSVTVPPVGGTDTVKVRLENLMEDTEYFYRVRNDDVHLSPVYAFRTAKPLSTAAFSFILFSDTGFHDGFDQSGQHLQKNHSVAMQAHMDAHPVDFLIHAGDLSQTIGADGEYQRMVFDMYNDGTVADWMSSIPVYPCVGNHDVSTDGSYDAFNAIVSLPTDNSGTKRYYSFDYGNAHFTALDSNYRADHYAWAAADLGATDRHWTFVFFHHPMHSARGADGNLSDGHVWGTTWEQLITDHADVVFHGHRHHVRRTYPLESSGDVLNPRIIDPPEWNRGTVFVNGSHSGYMLSSLDQGGSAARPPTVIAADGGNLPAFTRVDVTESNLTLSIYRVRADLGHISTLFRTHVIRKEQNRAPVVNAGPDQSVVFGVGNVWLAGSVEDDGVPWIGAEPRGLTVQWSKVDGPGEVALAAPGSAETAATFSAPGAYRLRLTAHDTDLSAFDEVVITLRAPGTGGGALIVSDALNSRSSRRRRPIL